MPSKNPPTGLPSQAIRNKNLRKSPVLTAETQKVIAKLKGLIGGSFITYWTSSGGSICQDDVMAMAQLLDQKSTSSKTLGLFLKSDGGNPQAALRLMHLFRNYFERIVLFAPFECASAGTMVALGCDEIHMGATSFLTAVDTSLKHELSPVDHGNNLVSVSQDEVMRIIRMWKENSTVQNPYPEIYKYLHPLVLGSLDRSSSLSIRICRELLGYHMKDKKRAEKISRDLNSSYPSHSYPITAKEASRLGLNVKPLSDEVHNHLLQLNNLYSHMAQPLLTDFDQQNYHNNEICNIIERDGVQMYYQVDKDWHYRTEERRWTSLNDSSGWHKVSIAKGKSTDTRFYIR
ncbi:MAG: hypothetical protein SGI71_06875 [Verrucomicrobiota bacterium]|nr:hypothetical protein [Verrucomicrobiota bacterium]